MSQMIRRFVQLWERRPADLKSPVGFYFGAGPNGEDQTFYMGPIRRIAKSRSFINHHAVYGFINAEEVPPHAVQPPRTGAGRRNRLLRRTLLARGVATPLVAEQAPAISEPAPAVEQVAAKPAD